MQEFSLGQGLLLQQHRWKWQRNVCTTDLGRQIHWRCQERGGKWNAACVWEPNETGLVSCKPYLLWQYSCKDHGLVLITKYSTEEESCCKELPASTCCFTPTEGEHKREVCPANGNRSLPASEGQITILMIRPSLAAGNSSDFLSSTSSLGCNKANCCFSPCTSVQTRRGCLSKERASHFHIVLSAEISPRNAIGGLSRHLPVKTCMLTWLCGFGTCEKSPSTTLSPTPDVQGPSLVGENQHFAPRNGALSFSF